MGVWILDRIFICVRGDILLDGLCVRRCFGQEGERLGRRVRDGHRRGLSEGV